MEKKPDAHAIRLYSYWRSSSAWRVRIALNFKGVAHELVPVHLLRDGGEQRLGEFTKKNPLGEVPMLELDTDTGPWRLTQSMAILEYLEERYPHPKLLPTDPRSRARVRQLSELVNSGIQPFQNLKSTRALSERGIDPAPLVKARIVEGLLAMETLAASGAGRFLVGDAPTFADLFLVPQLYGARRFSVDVTAFSLLRRVEAECEGLPEFRKARPEAQPDWEDVA